MTAPKPIEPPRSAESEPPDEGKRAGPTPRPPVDAENLALARFVAEVVDEQRGQDLVILDLRGELDITDYFVIGTASSERHAWATAEEVESRVKRERRRLKHHLEGQRGARWVLLDYGAVVLHVFCADTREYYDLEFLWGHVPRVPLVEGGPVGSDPAAEEPAGAHPAEEDDEPGRSAADEEE